QWGDGARKLVAFVLFFPDGKDADLGAFAVENGAGVDFAHDGELDELARRTIDVGADIYHDHGISGERRKDAGERGAIDPADDALHHFRSGHDCAGVARGDEALSCAIAYEPGGDAHGAVPLRANRTRRAVMHGDLLAGVDDFNGELAPRFVIVELAP